MAGRSFADEETEEKEDDDENEDDGEDDEDKDAGVVGDVAVDDDTDLFASFSRNISIIFFERDRLIVRVLRTESYALS